MFGAIKKRRRWVAVIISLLAPFVGMLYLGRGRWALAYFVALLAIAVGGFVYLPVGARPNDAANLVQILSSLLTLAAMTQAFFIAKNWQIDESRGWFCRNWLWIGATFYGFFGLLLVVRTFVYQPFSVPSASMIPTVQIGDFFLASKSAYNSASPARGDIVVFHTDAFVGTTFFKRVIGLPGERVQLIRGTVFVNGQALRRKRIDGRPQISGLLLCDAAIICEATEFVETLPSGGAYDVLELAPDGPSDNTEIFVVPANSYFVLGDNRDNSEDSRNGLGFVKRDDIIGRAAYKYISDHHWIWQPIR